MAKRLTMVQRICLQWAGIGVAAIFGGTVWAVLGSGGGFIAYSFTAMLAMALWFYFEDK